jgi:hypothetical protein
MERHEHDLKQKITNICELILHIRLYKSGFSPTALEQGLIASICGMTNEGQDIFSSTGLSCSRTTVKKVLDYFINAYVARVKEHIQHARVDKNHRLMVILDNYNVLRWLKRMMSHNDFTRNIASLSVLIKSIPYSDSYGKGSEESKREAFESINFEELRERLSEEGQTFFKESDRGFILQDNLRDDKNNNQSLFEWYPYPSFNLKSSSEHDILIVINQFLEEICGLSEKEIIVLDPEILLFSKLAHMFPDRANEKFGVSTGNFPY